MNKENKKETKKERVLSPAEKLRAERFGKLAEEMEQQGYVRHDLMIDLGNANRFALLLLIPLFIIGYGLYYLVYHRIDFFKSSLVIYIFVFVAAIVVHELIHGLCWSFFTPHHFGDIQFGFIKTTVTPYCTCLVPLKKGEYIFGSVMPLIILGILPMIIAIAIGNGALLFLGVVMADSAAGDIMVIQKVLGFKSNADDIVYMDHPTEAGCVVFEK